jgi:hypothetical protein
VAWSAGALVTLLSTVAIAVEIVFIGLLARTLHLRRVTVVSLLVGGGLSLAMTPAVGQRLPSSP